MPPSASSSLGGWRDSPDPQSPCTFQQLVCQPPILSQLWSEDLLPLRPPDLCELIKVTLGNEARELGSSPAPPGPHCVILGSSHPPSGQASVSLSVKWNNDAYQGCHADQGGHSCVRHCFLNRLDCIGV